MPEPTTRLTRSGSSRCSWARMPAVIIGPCAACKTPAIIGIPPTPAAQATASAASGDIVVALVVDEEATLNRLRKKGASIALEAANPAYETRIFGPGRVRVQGRLVALFRQY